MTTTVEETRMGPGRELTLISSDPNAASEARKSLRAKLILWGLEQLTDDAMVVVSELASNAILHTGGTVFGVIVNRVDERTVRITVRDCSRSLPVKFSDSSDAEQGRGIAVIESLSIRWGVTLLAFGKHVWAELRTKRHPKIPLP